jgi:hypothetical protein
MTYGTLLPDYQPRGGRVPPGELVAELREIDPKAELIYAGRGKWILGTVDPNRIRERKACKMIGTILAVRSLLDVGVVDVPSRVIALVAYRLWYYELVRQGFRIIQAYNFQGEPTSHIAWDFRKRDWFYRHYFARELKRFEEAADADAKADAQLDKLREYLESEYESIHRFAFRGKRSFTAKIPRRRPSGRKRVEIVRP